MAKIRVVSTSGEPFIDRVQAGELLAAELDDLRGKDSVVLGIPRGGVIVACGIARGIEGDLDIALSRKLGTPGHAELAMGSLSETGNIFLNRDVVSELGITEEDIQQEKAWQMREIQRRNQIFRRILPRTQLKGRIVVVTDDGVATGATLEAALWAVRQEGPQTLIAAIPVASEEAVRRLGQDVDKLLCLRMPPFFAAVGQFYLQFSQISDDEVQELLEEEARRRRVARKKQDDRGIPGTDSGGPG